MQPKVAGLFRLLLLITLYCSNLVKDFDKVTLNDMNRNLRWDLVLVLNLCSLLTGAPQESRIIGKRQEYYNEPGKEGKHSKVCIPKIEGLECWNLT